MYEMFDFERTILYWILNDIPVFRNICELYVKKHVKLT